MNRHIVVFLLLLMTLVALTPTAQAAPVKVFSDPSDGYVRPDGGTAGSQTILAGSTSGNDKVQGFVKFSLTGISGALTSARLYLYVYGSEAKRSQHLTSPITSPGLGNCLVRHVADYGILGTEDLDAPSIGNDPGVLLSDTVTPDIGYVSIDVKAAMQDDVNKVRAFSTFMIKMAVDTNNDGISAVWYFYSIEGGGTSKGPYVEFEIGSTTASTLATSTSPQTVIQTTSTVQSTSPNIALRFDPLLAIGIAVLVVAVIIAAILLMKRKPSVNVAMATTPPFSQTIPSSRAAAKYCINCGASIPETSRYCGKCGGAQW